MEEIQNKEMNREILRHFVKMNDWFLSNVAEIRILLYDGQYFHLNKTGLTFYDSADIAHTLNEMNDDMVLKILRMLPKVQEEINKQ